MKSLLPPLDWRPARSEDLPAMTRIYNESVQGGGHSPMLGDATPYGLSLQLKEGRENGWPMWVLASGSDIIGWAYLRRIVWGGAACNAVADLWIYVARAWHGSGVAMLMARHVHPQILRHGFDTLTCWILGGNRRSLSLVRGCRLKRWAVLPDVVRYGDRTNDLEIWGVRADDPQWQDYMIRMDARYRRLEQRARLAGAPVFEPSRTIPDDERVDLAHTLADDSADAVGASADATAAPADAVAEALQTA
ncbi:L-amino acid N-acyltransferase YncA [Roseateles sp. YR242]|uniref:GNAT family N-acetyltransferase n=1 Tax=Roseateles sp. YR242 TaxID=1855305 RepID=UPI0008AC5FF5|nr:hypothetical protein [Roseateles sp. YR242]SEK51406.1 L-amino acid N-acyltransferase YncA [Roseateles sp. YR242]